MVHTFGRPDLVEQEIGVLLDVVAVAHAVVAQDVAEVPGFLVD